MINSMRAVRAPKRQRKATGHVTREKLLKTAADLLEARDIAEITSEMVLEASGISRGSLYHHFEDFSDLLEQTLVRKFSALVDASIEVLAQLAAESGSAADMLARLSVAIKAIHAPASSRNRYFRARIIALSESNDRLKARLGVEQKRLTDSLTALFETNQQRGWMRPDFDPTVASIFIQAYTLGRVIDDVSQDKVDPDHWDDFISQAIRALFF